MLHLSYIFKRLLLFLLSGSYYKKWVGLKILKANEQEPTNKKAKWTLSYFAFDLTRDKNQEEETASIAWLFAKKAHLKEGLGTREVWIWSNVPDNSIAKSPFSPHNETLTEWISSCLGFPAASPQLTLHCWNELIHLPILWISISGQVNSQNCDNRPLL